MPKQIIIAEQHRIAAVFWEDQIQELVVATGSHQVSDIYLGVVENVLPGIDAAFVNIGDAERNGFIHVTDLGPLRLKRASGAITELLSPQQKVLVQVMKEPTGNKGPRLTGNISLPGRYLVLMPYGRGVNLSRRIKNENERNRLRALAVLIKPAGMGLLVRTEAEGKAEEAIIEDLETLQKQWELTLQEANSTRAPALLNRDDDFIQRVLRDMYTAEVNRIVVDSNTGVKRVKQYLLGWNGGRLPEGVLIDQHRLSEGAPKDSRQSILEYFRVNAAIREALKPRVDLPSGGYIIIQPTEALTVIDVNSGSFTRSATARETVLWTNCEAATEIARQMRLRNIAGVIIVDFIDMDTRRDQLQVLEHFNKALKADKARPQIAQLSELGLVELTRKRQGKNVYELFGEICPECGGLGHIVHLPGETSRSEVEISEPILPIIAKETRTIPYPIPATVKETIPDESWETRNEGLDYGIGDEDEGLDLIHHPSYQEQGGIGANRRRRRRQIGMPAVKEEVSKTPLRISTPSPIVGNTGYPTTVRGFQPNSLVESEKPVSDSFANPTVEERFRIIKPERPKPTRQEIEPPEIVSIEMTPEEQDVYAFMGISPAVKLDREVKNPRSMIISVIAPGESPESGIAEARSRRIVTPRAESADNEIVEVRHRQILTSEDDSAETTISEVRSGVILNSESEQEFSEVTIPSPREEIVSQELELSVKGQSEQLSLPFVPETSINEQSESSIPVNRRRRRRSSALETSDSENDI